MSETNSQAISLDSPSQYELVEESDETKKRRLAREKRQKSAAETMVNSPVFSPSSLLPSRKDLTMKIQDPGVERPASPVQATRFTTKSQAPLLTDWETRMLESVGIRGVKATALEMQTTKNYIHQRMYRIKLKLVKARTFQRDIETLCFRFPSLRGFMDWYS